MKSQTLLLLRLSFLNFIRSIQRITTIPGSPAAEQAPRYFSTSAASRFRRHIRPASGSFIAVLLAIVLTGHCALADGKLEATVIAERGSVTVDRAGGPQGHALALDDSLGLGDTVVTGADGQCEILFLDGSQAKLDSNSSIRVCTTAPSERHHSIFQALVGVIWAHIRPGQVILTPAANVVVRGTEVALDISDDGATQLTVVNGDALFQNAFGQVEVTDDEQSTAKPGQAPTAPFVVDVSGLISWTGDVVGLPLVFEMPSTSPGDKLRQTGDASGALTAYAAVLAADPNDANAIVGTSLTELSQGKADVAKASLAPISTQPISVAVSGLIDLESGNGTTARQEFLSATSADPTLYQAQSLLAISYLQDGDMTDAESAARKADTIAPRSAEATGTLSTILFFEGKIREAAAYSRLAVAIDPDSPFSLLTQGRTDASAGKYELARTEYEKALAFAPRLWLVHQELGEIYQKLDDPRKAAEEYQIALKLDPTSPDAYTGLGKALQATGRYPAAHDAFVQAITLAPKSPSARYYYASYLVDRGDLDGALQQIQSTILSDPSFGLLYARLAEVYLYKQDLADAQKYALKAVKLLPSSAIAHYELGRVNYEEQHTYQAEQEFRIATVLDPRLAPARYALGLVQEKTESGLLDSFSSIFDSASVGSPASSTTLNNLQTPGANERIQAAVADPTAVRSATRSYGNTEVDAVAADDGSYDGAASYLGETKNGAGVAGVGGATQFQGGVRQNSDSTINDANFVVGEDAQDRPLGYLVLGDYEQTNDGQDTGISSNPANTTYRFRTQLNRIISGVNVKTGGSGNVLAIIQASDDQQGGDTWLPLTDPNFYSNHLDTDSLDGEVRWNIDPEQSNSFTAGLSYGDRRRLANSSLGPAPIFSENAWFRDKPFQAYIRDDFDEGRKWSFVAQMQVVQETPTAVFSLVGYPPPLGLSISKTLGLPYGIVSYKPDNNTVLRFRYRRLQAAPTDFQLINPTDDFLLTFADLPTANSFSFAEVADGQSAEFEVDKTLPKGGFASAGVYRQALNGASVAESQNQGLPYPSCRVEGAQASYQGLLSKTLSYFMLGEYTNAEEDAVPQRVPGIPRYVGIGTVQYLDTRGFYGQIAYYYQGDRITSDTDRSDQGAFGILNLRVGKRYGLRTNVFAELDNALNKQYEEFGLLQHGTEGRLGISQRY